MSAWGMIALIGAIACSNTPESSDLTPAPDASPVADASAPDDPRVRLMLHGGGGEEDAVYYRFVAAAGEGHIVTLGAVQDPDNYPYLLFWNDYFVGLGARSAETINTETREQATAAAAQALRSADAIFMRGGDQSRYVEFWRNTPIHDELLAAWRRGAVIGGSSAGAALLGRPLYDARVAGVAAYEALVDPFDPAITFTDEMIPALDNIVVDTHFTERGRLGRLAVFMLRAPFAQSGAAPLGLGVDPQTAALIYDDGTLEVIGRGSVTLLDPRAAGPATISPGQPPAIDGMYLWQLPAGYHIDLHALRDQRDPVLARPDYVAMVPRIAPAVPPLPDRTIDGDDVTLREIGDLQLSGLDSNRDAWRDRSLTLDEGTHALPLVTLVTGLYSESEFFENHFGGMMWAVAQRPEMIAVGVDILLIATTSPPRQISAGTDGYALIIDARAASHAGVPDAGWQTAAVEQAVLRVITAANPWDGSPTP